MRWFWALHTAKPPNLRTDGHAPTLDEAKAQFETTCRRWLEWAGLVEMAVSDEGGGLSRTRRPSVRPRSSVVTSSHGPSTVKWLSRPAHTRCVVGAMKDRPR